MNLESEIPEEFCPERDDFYLIEALDNRYLLLTQGKYWRNVDAEMLTISDPDQVDYRYLRNLHKFLTTQAQFYAELAWRNLSDLIRWLAITKFASDDEMATLHDEAERVKEAAGEFTLNGSLFRAITAERERREFSPEILEMFSSNEEVARYKKLLERWPLEPFDAAVVCLDPENYERTASLLREGSAISESL